MDLGPAGYIFRGVHIRGGAGSIFRGGEGSFRVGFIRVGAYLWIARGYRGCIFLSLIHISEPTRPY